MESKAIYRYPGSRPFEDTDIDRKLFFGREREKVELLQKILDGNLVVLHAVSGLGKTSLLNAGVSQLLRDRGFLTIKIRFNMPETRPVQAVFSGVKEAATQQHLDIEPGETETLWHYFKTAAFWSFDDSLLTPVLIFDQFEEFFAFHEPEARAEFTLQLADIVHNTIPRALRQAIRAGEPYRYGEDPPRVKMVISIRGDYLGHLDELSSSVPEILDNRYRLSALTQCQAREAITGPAQMEDEQMVSRRFRYSEDALDMMLDYLSKRREKGGVVNKDEVESFQLQLLCRHIETNILEKTDKVGVQDELEVKKEDLGGEAGMYKVFQSFYENQLANLKPALNKRRVRRLCEKGLISDSDRRLSLEAEVIEKQFKVSPALLGQLVDNRLLRAEKRVGSVYYELSHDSLIVPIRLSQRERTKNFQKKNVNRLISLVLFIAVVLIFKMDDFFKTVDLKEYYGITYASIVFLLLFIFLKTDHYEKLLEGDHEDPDHYFKLGKDYHKLKKYDAAIANYRKALDLNPDLIYVYDNMGIAQGENGDHEAAIASFKKVLELKPDDADAYYNIGNAEGNIGDYDAALACYRKTLELKPDYAEAYNNMGIVYRIKGDYDVAMASFHKALELNPTHLSAKGNIAVLYLTTEQFDKAIKLANKVLKEKQVLYYEILAMTSIARGYPKRVVEVGFIVIF